jgi:hypothetical protein
VELDVLGLDGDIPALSITRSAAVDHSALL